MPTIFKQSNRPLLVLYLIFFFVFLNFSIPVYVASTFLTTLTTEALVGIVYAVSSLFAIIAISISPFILKKLGNYHTFLIFLSINLLTLLGIAFFESSSLIILLFIINQIVGSVMAFNLDIFLEAYTDNEETGSLRGMGLTIANTAFLVGPLLAGFILTNGDFWKIYLITALVTLPILFLTRSYFKNFKDPVYVKTPFLETFWRIVRDKNIRSIFISSYILRFFYAWMVIYMPIYLHQHIGLEWSTIGIIFFIMILPFVILEIPLGRIADKFTGEKEILTVGFIIMGFFTVFLAFSTSTNPAWWAFLLFGTRIGASAVEVMTETYFFKLIDAKDTNIISFFRNTRPLAYLSAPLIASVILAFFDFRFIFVVLAVIVFMGIFFSLSIKDTR